MFPLISVFFITFPSIFLAESGSVAQADVMEDVVIKHKLGAGSFGEVYYGAALLACLTSSGSLTHLCVITLLGLWHGNIECALKRVKLGDEDTKAEFIAECMMLQ